MLTVTCIDERRFSFDATRTALLVIDMQRDFCCEGGYFGKTRGSVAAFRAIIPSVRRVLEWARTHEMPIVHTREGHRPDLSDCPPGKLRRSQEAGAAIGSVGAMGRLLVRGEYGHDFIDELRPASGEIVIDKPGFSAFSRTNLGQVLDSHRISHLILTGITTDVCVHSTLREAVEHDYGCLTIADATAAGDPTLHEAAIRMIHGEGGIFGHVATTRALISASSSMRASERSP